MGIQDDIDILPTNDEVPSVQTGMPKLEKEDAIALQEELFYKYSDPEFQLKLFQTYAMHDPQSPAYCKAFGALLRSAHADVLPKYGLPAGQKGDVAMAIALSEHQGDNESQVWTARIQDQLYDGEAPMVKGSNSLTKMEILSLCREQLAVFRQDSFQRKIGYLKVACRVSRNDDCFQLEGRDKLVAAEQATILSKYGLRADKHGAHSLLQQLAQHIMDPQVATCAEAVNTLLGMEATACDRFTARLRDIAVNDPCPRIAKEKSAAPKKEAKTWADTPFPSRAALARTARSKKEEVSAVLSLEILKGAEALKPAKGTRSVAQAARGMKMFIGKSAERPRPQDGAAAKTRRAVKTRAVAGGGDEA